MVQKMLYFNKSTNFFIRKARLTADILLKVKFWYPVNIDEKCVLGLVN